MKMNAKRLTVLSFIVCFLFAASGANAWWIFGKEGKPDAKTSSQSKPQSTQTLGEAPKPIVQVQPREPEMQRKSTFKEAWSLGFDYYPKLKSTSPSEETVAEINAERSDIIYHFVNIRDLTQGIINIIEKPEFMTFTGADLLEESDSLTRRCFNILLHSPGPDAPSGGVIIRHILEYYVTELEALYWYFPILNKIQDCTFYGNVVLDRDGNPILLASNCYTDYADTFHDIESKLWVMSNGVKRGTFALSDTQDALCRESDLCKRRSLGETGTREETWQEFWNRCKPGIRAYLEMSKKMLEFLGYEAPPPPTVVP